MDKNKSKFVTCDLEEYTLINITVCKIEIIYKIFMQLLILMVARLLQAI